MRIVHYDINHICPTIGWFVISAAAMVVTDAVNDDRTAGRRQRRNDRSHYQCTGNSGTYGVEMAVYVDIDIDVCLMTMMPASVPVPAH